MSLLDTLIDHTNPEKKLIYNQSQEVDIPIDIAKWFRNLTFLKGVPLSYIIPHPQALPRESFKFFYLDTNWLKAMAAGAFSIGNYRQIKEVDNQYQAIKDIDIKPITGILLRTDIVKLYPGMHLKGYAEKDIDNKNLDNLESLDVLRNEKLTPDTRLVLFDGEVNNVAMFSPPESLEVRIEDKAAIDQNNGVILTEKISGSIGSSSSNFVREYLNEGCYIIYKRGND